MTMMAYDMNRNPHLQWQIPHEHGPKLGAVILHRPGVSSRHRSNQRWRWRAQCGTFILGDGDQQQDVVNLLAYISITTPEKRSFRGGCYASSEHIERGWSI